MPAGGPRALNEPDSTRLLREYGINAVEERVVKSADEAVQTADAIGYPVVLKAVSRMLRKNPTSAR